MTFDPTTLLFWIGGLSTLSVVTASTDGARDFTRNGIDYYGVRDGAPALLSVFTASCALAAGSWAALGAYKLGAGTLLYVALAVVGAVAGLLFARKRAAKYVEPVELSADDLPDTLSEPSPVGEFVQLLGPLAGDNSETAQVQYLHEGRPYAYTAMTAESGAFGTGESLRVRSVDKAGILHLTRA